MSENPESSEAVADQDYDELDDLLDEDPTKLEVSQPHQEPHKTDSNDNKDKNNTSSASDKQEKQHNQPQNAEDPEVKQMITDLEQEFAKLMNQDGNGGPNTGEQENFKQILEMLNEVSKDTQKSTASNPNTTTAPNSDPQGPAGFKNVVSKTLERLKENGSKVDHNIAQEQDNQQDIFTQLLSELTTSESEIQQNGNGTGEDGVDDAILAMLNQMSSKQVLYEPMKEMHSEFAKWLDTNASSTNDQDLKKYNSQFNIVATIVQVFEKPSYTDEGDREEITNLLDQLEQLGDTPVSKAQNNPDQDAFGALDQELAQNCKQQ